MLSEQSLKLGTLYCITVLAKCKLTVSRWKTNEQQRSRLSHLSGNKLDKWTAFDASVDKFVSFRFPRSRFCNKNSSYKYLAQMNFISHSCFKSYQFEGTQKPRK